MCAERFFEKDEWGIKNLISWFYQVKWKRFQLKYETFLLKVSIKSKKVWKRSVLIILHTTFAGIFLPMIKNGYVELYRPFLLKFLLHVKHNIESFRNRSKILIVKQKFKTDNFFFQVNTIETVLLFIHKIVNH